MGYNCNELHVPANWQHVVELLKPGQTVAVIGATDVGKSAFCRWLVQALAERGTVGLVDCDLGQATLGPPTTVGGKVFETPPADCLDLWPPALGFVGSTSPQGHLLQTVAAAKAVCDRLCEQNPTYLVVDTTGLVAGGIGRALKLNKLRVIQADVAVLIERECELDGLAWALAATPMQVMRLPASPAVRTRSGDARRDRRREQFRAYFAGAETRTLDLHETLISGSSIGRGRAVDAAIGDAAQHLEVCGSTGSIVANNKIPLAVLAEVKQRFGLAEIGRLDSQLLCRAIVSLEDGTTNCLGLGVIESHDFPGRTLRVLTSVATASDVHAIATGSIRIANDGAELSGDPRPTYV